MIVDDYDHCDDINNDVDDYDNDSVFLDSARYRGLQTEKFSALLLPDAALASSGAGGTAIVSLAAQTGGFHLTLVTRGVWGAEDAAEGQLVVQMSARNSDAMTLDEMVNVASIKVGRW